MTTERMIELNILLGLSASLNPEKINAELYWARLNELLEEFLKPYVIDNAEKSE